jgi:paraquat-inducible protein B
MNAEPADMPSAVARSRRGLPIVWIIPIVAAAIGGWIWWSALQEVGPEITITFETAEGLEAGKTRIRYKDVVLGTVQRVMLADDLSKVTATCQLAPLAEPLLRESTRFWVVRPRIGAGGVSGLETLVSGAYIAMDPGSTGAPAERFKGLELPPVSPAGAPGLKLVLEADRLGSLDIGSPVHYRDLAVGHVERHHLSEDGQRVEIEVYVEVEHRHLVTTTTRFWSASGVSLALTADGFSLDTESLESLLSGGVAFETPADGEPGEPVANGARFELFESEREARDVFADSTPYVLDFQGSVRGLSVGAPVEFRGIRLGHVNDIWMEYHTEQMEAHIMVLVALQPGRVRRLGSGASDDLQASLDTLIERGMRARLAMGNLLTGALYVELDFHPDTEAVLTGLHPAYLEIPTIPSATEALLAMIEHLPLAELVEEAVGAVRSVAQLVGSPQTEQALLGLAETLEHTRNLARALDERAPDALADLLATARELRDAADAAQRILRDVTAEESELNYLLTDALGELSSTLRSVRVLADYLERHPEALLAGKPTGDDG